MLRWKGICTRWNKHSELNLRKTLLCSSEGFGIFLLFCSPSPQQQNSLVFLFPQVVWRVFEEEEKGKLYLFVSHLTFSSGAFSSLWGENP